MESTILESLFGSAVRVRVLKLFLQNSGMFFTTEEISRRCKAKRDATRRELSFLKKIDFVKEKTESVGGLIKLKNGKVKNTKKKVKGYVMNEMFLLLVPLKNLVLNAAPVDKAKMIRKISSAGRVKLVLLSGIFLQTDESEIDMLIVGDAFKSAALERVLKSIEAEIGKELAYTVFSTKEFLYRKGMYDRFIISVLDCPHEKIVNKLEI
jgi:hypothetical protein